MYPLPVHPPLSLTHNTTSPYPSSTARPIPYQQQRGVESSSEAWNQLWTMLRDKYARLREN